MAEARTGRRIPIFATVVVAAAVAVMIALGMWQLRRLDEKQAMIAEYARNIDDPAVLDLATVSIEQAVYRTVRLQCDAPADWIAVAGRNRDGQSGYVHRYTCKAPIPFGCGLDTVASCPGVFADIGWSQRPVEPQFAGGTITGMLVAKGPDFKVVSSEGLAGLEPVARPDPNDLPNNHLAYAMQWFFFALTAVVIYVLALRRRWR